MIFSKKCPHCQTTIGFKALPVKQGLCPHCDKPILYKLNFIKWMLLFVPTFTVSMNLLDKEVYGFWLCFWVMMPIYSLMAIFCYQVIKCADSNNDNEVT
ncbi:hypothetical protein [Shewanella sp.]|uniref:hypothetical protein n=1 Tax=Shewanella sp. TaxID=50422 RepID=UPI003A88BBC6